MIEEKYATMRMEKKTFLRLKRFRRAMSYRLDEDLSLSQVIDHALTALKNTWPEMPEDPVKPVLTEE